MSSMLRILAVAFGVVGLVLFIGSLIYGNRLAVQGLPCGGILWDEPVCATLLILFWVGAVFVGISVVVGFCWFLLENIQIQEEEGPSQHDQDRVEQQATLLYFTVNILLINKTRNQHIDQE